MGMELRTIPIAELKFADYNPRQISKENFARLRTSIKEFGMTVPCTVNSHAGRENVLIAGHMRTRAAQEEGMTEVPCFVVDIDPQKERLLNIALNNHNLEGDWDEQKLAEMIVQLNQEDVEVRLTGFDEMQVSNILDDYMDTGRKDEAPEPLAGEPDSKPGTLYELGRHRLLCGDSTKPEDINRLMGDQHAAMVFMDPPYNVNYSGEGEKTGEGIKNDNMSPEAFAEFSRKIFTSMSASLRQGGVFYICSGWSSYPQFAKALADLNIAVRGVIVWVKNNAALGWNDYHYKHEFILKGKKERQAKNATKAVGILYGWTEGSHEFYGSKDQYDVWEMPRDAVDKYEHPTQKPDWLPMRAILNSSKRGEIVLDLFGGSGSTMMACEKTGRAAYMIELDPKYCDVIRKRYAAYVEKAAQ